MDALQRIADLSVSAAAPVPVSGLGSSAVMRIWNGDKFPGGFGATFFDTLDYWELRQRSAQLFTENLYARGLIRRLVTNEISTGLLLEAEPNDALLETLSDEQADEWSEGVESRFEIWGANPKLCDYEERRTFSELQEEVRREALVEGDTLVVLRTDRRTGLPKIQLIRGGRVNTPLSDKVSKTNRTIHGVELDRKGRQIAYWVNEPPTALAKPGVSTRIPAFGERSGRRLAWLVYGTDRRVDQVRGTPMLSLVLQSLKEIDRYRDSEQRAAVVNSLLAMFMEKKEDRPGTMPLSGGAIRQTRITGTGLDNAPREYKINDMYPGMAMEELQTGETPKSFDTSRPNVNYAAFEAAILGAVAWANEMPPEILQLQFSNNYSASKAAINEFKVSLVKKRLDMGTNFCQHIYVEWLIAETLAGRVDAPGLLEAWRDPLQYDVFGAWIRSSWSGPVKPSVDLGKEVKAYTEAWEAGAITMDRMSKDLFGVRYSRVVKRRKKERRMREEAGETSAEQQTPAAVVGEQLVAATSERVLALVRSEQEEAIDG